MSKDNDIDKIDEQIQSILDEEKEIYDEDSEKKLDVVDEDTSDDEITKELKSLDDIESNTKKLHKVEDIEKESTEEVIEEKTADEKKDEEVQEESPIKKEEKPVKKNNKNILIIIAFVILILLVIFLLSIVLKKDTKKNEVSDDVELTKAEKEEIINNYGDALKGAISVFYDKEGIVLEYDDASKLIEFDYDVKCDEHEIYEDGNLYLSKCSINGENVKYSYGTKQEKKEEVVEETDDGGIKVYVNKKDKTSTFTKPSNEDNYDVYSFKIDGEYDSLTLLDDKYVFYYDSEYNVQMINFTNGKKALSPLKYDSILPIKYDETYDNYVAVLMNGKWGIYNLYTRERITPHIYDYVAPNLYMGISGPPLYINSLEYGKIAVVEDSKTGVIDYNTGKEIIPTDYKYLNISGDYLWAVDDDSNGHVLDFSGKEYVQNKFDYVYGIVSGQYILVKDDENIKIVNIKGKELYDYGQLEFKDYNFGIEYNGGALFQLYKNGAEDSDCLEVLYNSSDKTGETKDISCGGIAKPILYLYPKKETKVTVSFEHPEYLETTYPKFIDKWEVTAKSNGDLYDKDNKYYYALYWDEKKIHSVDFSTGYYVEDKDAIEFLEKKLKYIGLSMKERNEFIMYWLPVLEKNKKSLVYFELTDERESYNKLNISPKPDSLLRIVIHIKKVDGPVDIPSQKLTKFQRKGFVAVEWGGTTY